MKTMKSVKLTGIKKLEIVDEPIPEIENAADVLLKVDVVGICGSDVHYYTTGKIGTQVAEYPFTVGHEFSATVVETGTDCRHLQPGDRVAVDPLVYCGTCEQCLQGRFNTCLNQKFLGCPGQMEGCLKEYIIMPEYTCYKLSETINQEDAAICEPLAIGCYTADKAGNLENKSIAVLGAGPIGLSVLQTSLLKNPQKVYMTDLLDYRCRIAHTQGADWVGNPHKTDCFSEISLQEPNLLDVIFECCGQQEALDMAVELAKPGGEIIIVGIPEFDHYSFNAHKVRRKELTIKQVRRQNESEKKTLDLVSKGFIDPSYMATHRFSLSQVQKAFDLVANYEDGVIKALIVL
jgi:L-iditol 2-dehydrogenase